MGQYYMAYVDGADGKRVFCPQNAVYMTKNGIASSKEMGKPRWNDGGTDSWSANFSGLKLMEHSWLGNDFVNGVLESIWDNPSKVAWVGDYADQPSDFDDRYTERVYASVWGDGVTELPFGSVPTEHATGFLANLDRGVFVDIERYAKESAFSPSWDSGVWVTHPLPLLTCIGNGRGGGDYWGTCMDMVGSWAMDELVFTEDEPEGLAEVDYSKVRFVER